MKRYPGFKIATLVLSIVLFLESLFLIFLLVRPYKEMSKIIPHAIKGKIAIVLDDWGYQANNLSILDGLKYPLTMSILPNLKYSQTLMQEFHRRGYEVILHLPMEPYEKYHLEKDTILTSMDEPAIKKIVSQDLGNIFYAQGVSNHMGSRASEDSRVMGIVFTELKKRKLYFSDSFVSQKSVCLELAKRLQLRFARRDVFLDNKNEPEYIRLQLEKLKKKASVYGQAIGIGHDRRVTLEVLRAIMPEAEKEGYKFVFLSDLIK